MTRTDEHVPTREARTEDAPAISRIYAPYVRDTAVTFELEPPDARVLAGRIDAGRAFVPWRVAPDDGRVAGYAYAGPFRGRPAYRWTCETTVYVEAGRARTGLGRALMRDLLSDLSRRGFRTVVAVVTLPNPVSTAFHEALGFRHVGVFGRTGFKLGRWHDTSWWTLDLAPGDAPPRAEPRLGPIPAGPPSARDRPESPRGTL